MSKVNITASVLLSAAEPLLVELAHGSAFRSRTVGSQSFDLRIERELAEAEMRSWAEPLRLGPPSV